MALVATLPTVLKYLLAVVGDDEVEDTNASNREAEAEEAEAVATMMLRRDDDNDDDTTSLVNIIVEFFESCFIILRQMLCLFVCLFCFYYL